MTTRFVGLPSGTASEAAFATATAPTKNGAKGTRHRRTSARTTGTIKTTAPSSDAMHVSSPDVRQTSA